MFSPKRYKGDFERNRKIFAVEQNHNILFHKIFLLYSKLPLYNNHYFITPQPTLASWMNFEITTGCSRDTATALFRKFSRSSSE